MGLLSDLSVDDIDTPVINLIGHFGYWLLIF